MGWNIYKNMYNAKIKGAVDLLAPVAYDLAMDEGLYAHANAAKVRMNQENGGVNE